MLDLDKNVAGHRRTDEDVIDRLLGLAAQEFQYSATWKVPQWRDIASGEDAYAYPRGDPILKRDTRIRRGSTGR